MIPAISVLMPVWNGCNGGKEAFLRQAIESILAQTLSDIEMVIIDDGSTDGTPAILDEYAARDERVRIDRNERNMRIVAALNRGLGLCLAPMVARQDSDDVSDPNRLMVQKNFMDARPGTTLCGTGMRVIDESGAVLQTILHPASPLAVREAIRRMCPFVHGSVMFRKDAIIKAGGYSSDPRYEYAEDYELWSRLVATGHVLENMPNTVLYSHRNHANKSSLVHRGQQDVATRQIISRWV